MKKYLVVLESPEGELVREVHEADDITDAKVKVFGILVDSDGKHGDKTKYVDHTFLRAVEQL